MEWTDLVLHLKFWIVQSQAVTIKQFYEKFYLIIPVPRKGVVILR
jgi:hypothetical protein